MTLVLDSTTEFDRDYKKLQRPLQLLTKERLNIFIEDPFARTLKTHKLSGNYQDVWAFSVDHRYRVLFWFPSKGVAELLRVDDHSVYRKRKG